MTSLLSRTMIVALMLASPDLVEAQTQNASAQSNKLDTFQCFVELNAIVDPVKKDGETRNYVTEVHYLKFDLKKFHEMNDNFRKFIMDNPLSDQRSRVSYMQSEAIGVRMIQCWYRGSETAPYVGIRELGVSTVYRSLRTLSLKDAYPNWNESILEKYVGKSTASPVASPSKKTGLIVGPSTDPVPAAKPVPMPVAKPAVVAKPAPKPVAKPATTPSCGVKGKPACKARGDR